MSAFEDAAVTDIMRIKVADEVEGYLVAAINLIISLGYVNPTTTTIREELATGKRIYNYIILETEYYACAASKDHVLTQEALEDIIKSGIDYSRCTDPSEHTGEGFNGTFNEDTTTFHYLKSEIYSGSGKFYLFTLDWDHGFAELINKLGEYNKKTSFQYATKRLEKLNKDTSINWKLLKEQQSS